MSLILNIDTSGSEAHVSLARDGQVIHSISNDTQKDHAAFLQTAISHTAHKTGISLPGIDAVAVTAGPGSYTGLRVGMASAKGLCYARKKPLIALNTLEVLTASARITCVGLPEGTVFCPMIDARRMEVFTAIYSEELIPYLSPRPLILNEMSFERELSIRKILFFGSGSGKWKAVCNHPNALFHSTSLLPEGMAELAEKAARENRFADLAYSEPFYLKDFQALT